ncbi:hypothetical protein ACN28E_33895 [Archangium lansingense]|uniref:hypothetical protein n=1 Tax=Archangium lansingense TaxID=2995310 RepID=UPI003B76E08C
MLGCKRNADTPTLLIWSCLLLALGACTPPPPPGPRLQQVSIQGTAREGETLLTTLGGWSPPSGVSISHQWSRCNGQGQGCTALAGATQERYVITAEDVEATLKVSVQVTGQGAPYTVDSAPTSPVLMLAPVSTAAPTISGTVAVGWDLTGSTGTWRSARPATYAYQWLRCDATGAACVSVTGATSEAYTPVEDDLGATLRLRVTASNAGGSTSAESQPTAAVQHLAPFNTDPPTISGTASVGETLTGNPGTWESTLPVSYDYQWLRCDNTGAGCVTIAGATNSTYSVDEADRGSTLGLRVTATSTAGSATAESSATTPVPHRPPTNTALPTISGTATVGETLTGSPGTWDSALPVSYAYQWLRCDNTGASCVAIASARNSTYGVAEADRGKTLRLKVTATSTAGATTAESEATALVPPLPPTNTALPTISGTAAVGATLTGSPGTWDSAVTPSYDYQWLRCNNTGASCVTISGATSSTYAPVEADIDATFRLRVTASNSGGSRSADSARTAVVTPCVAVSQQGPFFPASARGVVSTRAWTNPSAAKSEDGTYATSGVLSPGDITDSLILRNWGFSIPTHAQILGIRAKIKRSSASGAGVVDYLVRLTQEGIFYLDNRAQPKVWGTTDEVITYGSATDTWGGNYFQEPWTAWDVNDPNFGIMIAARHAGSAGTDTARVDWVELTVFYRDSTAVGPNSPTVVADDASIGTIAWTNPQSAAAKDDVFAQTNTMVNNQLSHYLKATGFNFTPLAGRTLSGIVVEIRKKAYYSNPFVDEVVRLVQGGVVVGDNRPVSIYNSEPKYSVHGRPTDLWGLTLTATDLASPNFGVALASRYASVSGNGRAQIDHIRMWLLYDPFDTQVSKQSGTITSEQFSRDWALIDNSRLEDGARAAVYAMVYNEVSSTLETSGYGFTVPTNARIAGVELQVLRSSMSGVGVFDYRVRLRGPGQRLSANRAWTEEWKSTPERITYGRLSDRWGATWTPADINDPAFGVSFETHYPSHGGNDYTYVDSTALTVFYCPQ